MSAERWAGRACAGVVAAVAAYASYEHQRTFAIRGGADPAGASLWPLSVDGLLLLATIGLLKPAENSSHRAHRAVRLAFALGIAVSLAANVAAAPRPAWQPVLVAGWPPVALLLAVELLAPRTAPSPSTETSTTETEPPRSESESESENENENGGGTAVAAPESATPVGREPAKRLVNSPTRSGSRRSKAGRAEQVMWDYFRQQQERGLVPTGAELDRVAGTNNYGRAVLAKWRHDGRTAPPSEGAGAMGPRRADGG